MVATKLDREKRAVSIPIPVVVAAVLVGLAGAAVWFVAHLTQQAPQGPVLTAEAKAYVKYLQLGDVEMKAHESYSKQTLVEIVGKVTNAGPRALDRVEINCVFYDPYGQLVLRDRSKISPANEDDMYRRLSRTPTNDSGVSRLPLPLPPRAPKAGVSKDVKDEMEAARFQALEVKPGGTESGFFFFDLSETQKSMAGAHLYVTGVRDGGGNELMFFDIPLDKYLAASGSAAEP